MVLLPLSDGVPLARSAEPRSDNGCMGPRIRVEIEYCRQCRFLLRAAWLAQELLTTFDTEVHEVALVPGLVVCSRCG
jgi:hypothetical protein